MIQLRKVTKSYGARTLFGEVDWHIKPGERIGLVGENGAGKTTLLKIVAGADEASSGEISRKKGITVGHLFQEMEDFGDAHLLTETLGGRQDIQKLELAMEELTERMQHASSNDEAHQMAHELHDLQEKYEVAGGYSVEAEAKAILRGMGFKENDFVSPISAFSGGWRTRAQLARLLLTSPDLLLLDEPTNHLDLESTVWLENFLKNYKGAMILISHDRYFIGRLTELTAELEHGALTVWPYSHDKFVIEKASRRELLEKQATAQQKEIEKQEKFIERFRAKNTKASVVQSRVKALEKIERIELTPETKGIGFRFMEAGRTGQNLLELVDVEQGYGDNTVYKHLNFTLRRGERVALAGPNGAGKSTLLKILAGRIEIRAGRTVMGQNVSMRHYAQHQLEALDAEKSALDEVTDNVPLDSIPRVRHILGAFLFRGDDVFKKIKSLSGGEKARVALAKLALTPTNLLLLDEPTNHLDVKSREALETALRTYTGCIVIISHDRAFIDAVANKIIHVERGKLTEYLGNYSYYEEKRAEAQKAQLQLARNAANEAKRAQSGQKENRREAAKARIEMNEKIGPVKKTIERVEKEIASCEASIAELEAKLADPAIYSDPEKARVSAQELARAKTKNIELLAEWESLAEKMETIKAGFAV